MELVSPSVGTIFWMLLFFSFILLILKKFAWKPILNSLKDREKTIGDALHSAELAKEEMAKLKADNQKILAEARQERDLLMKEARAMKDKIIQDAQEQAQQEANKIVEAARHSIENEKKSAINDIKTQIALLSVTVAEKIIREKLDGNSKHNDLIDSLLKDVKLS
jgi:F-type H+-transporting ATPase subunit b